MVANKKDTTFDKPLILKKWGELDYKMICNSENKCLIDTLGNNTFTHTAIYPKNELVEMKTPIRYKLNPILKNNSFKYIALYQGKIGNKIKISFREFIDNMARPSFTQDIEYELNPEKNTLIGFKGLRIEVLDASNLMINYKVIKDYNKF